MNDLRLDITELGRPFTTNKIQAIRNTGQRSRLVKQWKDTGYWKWRQQLQHWTAAGRQVPPGPVEIEIIPLHKDRRSPQDVASCAPAAKAVLDGYVKAGGLPDDSPQYVCSIIFRQPWVCGANGLRMIVRECDDLDHLIAAGVVVG